MNDSTTMPDPHDTGAGDGSAVRFSLDPESGFVRDHAAGEWLTTPEEVFEVMFPLLPNNSASGPEHAAGSGYAGATGSATNGGDK